MKVSELMEIIVDDVVIYKQKNDTEFIDIFSGKKNQIPANILNMDIKVIGGKGKKIDIQVR